MSATVRIRLNRNEVFEFRGHCLSRVSALNHDDLVRRMFAVYSHEAGYVAERIDDPGTIDVRYWGCRCEDSRSLYEFFGNEPLANYLYGTLRIAVPGLHCVDSP